jgi:nitrogen fixation/metabolism regulation signal transduction histidine kinase
VSSPPGDGLGGEPGDSPRLRRRFSLRTRLLAAFITAAVVPCLILTVYISYRLNRSIEFWGNPGVERTVDSSVGAARGAVRELRGHLLESVEGIAEGMEPPGGLDVLRIYERVDGRFTLSEAEPSATGLLITPEEIEAALDGSRLIERPEGWMLALAAFDSASQRVVVGGYQISPELYAQIAEARRGASLFDRLGIYLAVSKRWIWLSTAGVLLGVLLAAAILARLVAHGLTRPIDDLVGAMGRLGRGERVPTLGTPPEPEMAYLVRSFNRMAAELERSRRELRRAERMAAWQEMARRVAHEIKNPLTPIQMAIHRIKGDLEGRGRAGTPGGAPPVVEPSRIGESLDAILGEVETLRHMADEFSRLAKLPLPELRPVDAGRLLAEVTDLYRETGVSFQLDIAPDLPAVQADPRLLRQVLTNLFKNAVEAMAGSGVLVVRARSLPNGSGAQVLLEIADSGPGIAAEVVDRVGEPYVTTKKGGSGLGLAVVSKIIADHRGRFELRNRPEGGALARVILPASAASPFTAPEAATA